MSRRTLFVVVIFLLLAILFITFPEIDLWFSSLFYTPKEGFFLKDNFFVKLIYNGVVIISKIFIITILLLLIVSFILQKRIFFSKKVYIYLLIVAILGPGFVVNRVLKDNWGRARPIQIREFGGDKKFTSPFKVSAQCETNCSFVCGHAASGFFFFTLIPLFRRYQKEITIFTISFGSLIGLARIMQGGHFLSDVIFSGFFVYFTYKIVYYFMFEEN